MSHGTAVLKPPRVLLVEMIHPDAEAVLRDRADVVVAPDFDEQTLLRIVGDVDAIVIRARGRIDEKLLAKASRLRVVARHGVGLDNVDVEACSRRGIWVVHTPLASVNAVAEHAVALMLAVAKGVVQGDQAVRAGGFVDAGRSIVNIELHGKTLGIVGFGRIGQKVAEVCRIAFAMPVLYADVVSHDEAARRLEASHVSLAELFTRSDIVSLHVPLTPGTRHLIDRATLGLLQPGAILVNTSRGAIVDEGALVDALRLGRLSAGLDVFEEEPLPASHPLAGLPNVVLTPHNASHTKAALYAMSMVVEDLLRVLEGESPKHPANLSELRDAVRKQEGRS